MKRAEAVYYLLGFLSGFGLGVITIIRIIGEAK